MLKLPIALAALGKYKQFIVHKNKLPINPKTGKLLETITVPHANLVTSCAFGGPDLSELFITTATVDLNEEQKRSQTLAGSLFRVQLDVKGVPAFRFKGILSSSCI